MNVANRVLVVFSALFFIFIVLLIILLAWAATPESIDRLGDLAEYMDAHDDNMSKLIVTLGGAVLILIALIVIIAELAPPVASTVAVREVKAGTAVLPTDAVARRIEQLVAEVAHVVSAKAKVIGRGRGVEVALELHVDPDSDLAATADEACRVVQDTLAQKMSVELSRPPHVHLHYEELRLAKAKAATPAAPQPAAAVAKETPAKPTGGRKQPTPPETPTKEEKSEQPSAAAEEQPKEEPSEKSS